MRAAETRSLTTRPVLPTERVSWDGAPRRLPMSDVFINERQLLGYVLEWKK